MATRAHTEAKNLWYRDSGILACEECEGHGVIDKTPWRHGNDPDRWEEDCSHCDGVGHNECAVCGFDIEIPGYDCLVCDTIRDIPDALLTDDTASQIGKAVAAGIIKIKHHHERVAQAEQAEARPALSYIPARAA
jgi:hypothetical protein